jgi:hypothetical protein
MASRYLNQFVLTQRKGVVQIAGTISLSAAAAVSSSDLTSLVSSVTKTGTGEYTIALADKWVGLISVTASLESSVATDSVQVKSADPVTAKTIVVRTITSGAYADVAVASKLHLSIQLKNSSVTR